MYPRSLDLYGLLEARSYFLFGPRGCGKTTLLEEETIASDLVVIDEVQKLPAILDEVHRLIESRKQRFLLTGSSARKLKRGGENFMAVPNLRTSLMPMYRPI